MEIHFCMGLAAKILISYRCFKIQNSAARVVEKKRKYDHITETLKELHWLPVEARIKFKLMTYVWKSLNGMAPPYLTNMLTLKKGLRNLRSDDLALLNEPRTNRKTMGDIAFEKAGPVLWNKLPIKIRTAETLIGFVSKLKTHLFIQYYV